MRTTAVRPAGSADPWRASAATPAAPAGSTATPDVLLDDSAAPSAARRRRRARSHRRRQRPARATRAPGRRSQAPCAIVPVPGCRHHAPGGEAVSDRRRAAGAYADDPDPGTRRPQRRRHTGDQGAVTDLDDGEVERAGRRRAQRRSCRRRSPSPDFARRERAGGSASAEALARAEAPGSSATSTVAPSARIPACLPAGTSGETKAWTCAPWARAAYASPCPKFPAVEHTQVRRGQVARQQPCTTALEAPDRGLGFVLDDDLPP